MATPKPDAPAPTDGPLRCHWPEVEGDLTLTVLMPPMAQQDREGATDYVAPPLPTPWAIRYTFARDGEGRHLLPRGAFEPDRLRMESMDGEAFQIDDTLAMGALVQTGASVGWRLEDDGSGELQVTPGPEEGCPVVRRVPVSDEATLVLRIRNLEPVWVQGCGLSVQVGVEPVHVQVAPSSCEIHRHLARRWYPRDTFLRHAPSLVVELKPGERRELDVTIEPGTWGLDLARWPGAITVRPPPHDDCEPFPGVLRGALVGATLLSFDGVDLDDPRLDIGVDLPALVLPEPGQQARFRFAVPGLDEPVSLSGTACDEPRPDTASPRGPGDRGWDSHLVATCRTLVSALDLSAEAYAERYDVSVSEAISWLERERERHDELVASGIDCDAVKREMAPWGAEVTW